jgi:hypothetical protein
VGLQALFHSKHDLSAKEEKGEDYFAFEAADHSQKIDYLNFWLGKVTSKISFHI